MFKIGDIVKVPEDSFFETLKGLRGEVILVQPRYENVIVRFTMENGRGMDFNLSFEEVELAQP